MSIRLPHRISISRFSLSPLCLALSFAIVGSANANTITKQTQTYQTDNAKLKVESIIERNDAADLVSRQLNVQTQNSATPVALPIAPTDLQVFSNSAIFDALFALTQAEIKANSVTEITDWSFNDQQGLACPCFETGAKWHYVWTRDLSYSLDLGLHYLDPARAMNSLLFKTSKVRAELVARGIEDTEVALQDTGSGGSWPVSSDRVVWILAASQLVPAVENEENPADAQQQWQDKWYQIAKQTLLQDRQYLYSNKLGIYRGETSFLDWREQTYPSWTANNTMYLAESHALSTNVLHYVALSRAAAAAEALDPQYAKVFRSWAEALKASINANFWMSDQGLYASYIGEEHNPMQVQHYDLLGLALAINHGVASDMQAAQILSNYPVTSVGAPVIFPALKDIPIYHNRAIWPFVSAYALRAAKKQNHPELYRRLAMSLFQGTAENGSNMENLEWLSLKPHVEDGSLSGPVINSQRQLWSVAAYHDFVVGQLFGMEFANQELIINPYLPVSLVRDLNILDSKASPIELQNLTFGELQFQVKLQLQGNGNRQQVYRLSTVTLNGEPVALNQKQGLKLKLADFGSAQNELVLSMMPVDAPTPTVNLLKPNTTSKYPEQLFSPKEPLLTLQTNKKGHNELSFARQGEVETLFTLYKNGVPVKLKRNADQFVDEKTNKGQSQCYALTQTHKKSGLVSLPSKTICSEGAVKQYTAGVDLLANDGEFAQYLGQAVYKNWGMPEHDLSLNYTASVAGTQRLQLQYYIDNGPINTGITAVVKRVIANCPSTGQQQSVLVMPHLATATELGVSSNAVFKAAAGEVCKLQIVDGFNMSYLHHFNLYTGGKGGRTGPLNQAVIAGAIISPTAD
jgi:hypothetical protein